ncbi:MAG: hypothetical protein ACYDA8_19650, partial [Deferrisomatales bacterium]
MSKRVVVAGIVLVGASSLCQAGWLGNTMEGAGKRLGNRAVHDAANSAYDGAKSGIKDAVKGDKESEDKSSPSSSESNQSARKESGQPETKGSASAAPGDDLSIEEAEKVYTKFDFIPGDKMLFFDDFSDTDVGEFPRKWTLEGPKPGANNTVDVVEYQGKRFLRSVPGAKGQPPATQYLRLDQKEDFPEKFTVEFDAVLDSISKGSNYYILYRLLFVSPDKKIDVFRSNAPNSIQLSGKENSSANTKTMVELNDGNVHHVSVSVNGTFVKA